jgi:hypothetical protein
MYCKFTVVIKNVGEGLADLPQWRRKLEKVLQLYCTDKGYTRQLCISAIMTKDIRSCCSFTVVTKHIPEKLHFYYNDKGYTKGAAVLLQWQRIYVNSLCMNITQQLNGHKTITERIYCDSETDHKSLSAWVDTIRIINCKTVRMGQ